MQQLDDSQVASLFSWSRAAVFLALSGYLLFAHGCHGDEDHELFAPLRQVSSTHGASQ